jgi:signal recognition particle subunit SRP54
MFSLLSDKLQDVFKDLRGHGKLSETNITDALREVRLALLDADVDYQVAKDFIARVKDKALGQEVLRSVTPGQQMVKVFADELTTLLGGDAEELNLTARPTRIMMVGLHGAGKTTTSAKLALWLKKQGKRPVLIPCDLHRPAAVTQLQQLGKQIGVPVFDVLPGEKNVLSVVRQAENWVREQNANVEIYDTAGRLEIDEVLVKELAEVKKTLSPSEVLIVCDAATGQQAVSVAKHFHEALGLTGIVLTKIDGDARGGAALSMREVTKQPIKFVGAGEKVEDLEMFVPDRFAGRILGMGDVVSLVEKAAEAIDMNDAMAMSERMMKSDFNLNDFLAQLQMVKKLGPLGDILKFLPGAGKISGEDMAKGQKQMKRTEAIIQSMTPQERKKPGILNARRRQRIAKGSGTSVTEVNNLLRQFEQIRGMMRGKGGLKQMMRQMGGMPGGKKGGRGPGGPGGLPPGFPGGGFGF